MRTLNRTHAARRFAAATLVAAVMLIGVVPAAFAQTTTAPSGTSTSTSADVPLPLAKGLLVKGATVNTPGLRVRKMNASQALGFMQGWYPYSVFNKVANEAPPAALPQSVIFLTTLWNGGSQKLTILFARKGETAWVGMPKQDFGWSFVQKLNWIRAPKGLVAAFEGKVPGIVNPVPTTTTTTPTTTASNSPASSSSDSHTGLWIGLIAAVLVIAGGGFALLRSKGRAAV